MTWILPKQLHTLASALDTEALSLDLNEQSQVCAQSLFVRSKPSQSRIWSAKWKRDSWTRHLSGRILRPSLGQRFATEWTSSLGATHASPSVQQASDSEVKTPGISGRISQEAFQFFNQESASLKTSRATLPVGCITFCATWEDWVTEQRGAYSARLNAAHLTNASGCSSWPTVRHGESWQGHGATQSYAENGANHQVNYRYNKQGEKISIPKGTFDTTLTTAVIAQNWPSPVASEVRQGFQDRSRGMKGSQESLTTVVIKGWPTPNAADSLQGGTTQGNRKDPNLSIAVHGPAVPASSSTDGSRPVSSTSRLNARWVETLMGLPVGWTMPSCASPVTIAPTSCGYSETVLSRQQQNEHSER